MSGSGPGKRRDGEDRRDGGAPAAVAGAPGPGEAASGADRLAAAVAELYGMAPEDFTGRRGELVATARGAGDRAAAKAIAALRRPTRAAWVVNRLARADPSAPKKLAELAAALRAAQEARHGPRLRELSAARGALVDALTAQALGVAGVPDPPPSLRLEIAETLTSAIADPDVAAAFAEGTLTRSAQWSGFGLPPAETETDDETDETPSPAEDESGVRPAGGQPGGGSPAGAAARPGTIPSRPRGGAGPAPAAGTGRARAGAGRAAPAADPAVAAARRQADDEERLAREVAELAARRREQHEEAQRVVAVAATAAATAGSAEDRLEEEVRNLEQRLTRARSDLAAARMRARHAEAAERRARQALDRLPGE